MKTAEFFVIVGLLLSLASSQPTFKDSDSSCRKRDNELVELLQNEFSSIRNKLSELEARISQLDSKPPGRPKST